MRRHGAWKAGGAVKVLFVLSLLSAMLSVGCIFVDTEVHPPDPHDLDGPRGVGRGREVIVDYPFFDKRYEPGRCGMQKNGYNTETSDVKCTVPPNRFLAALLHDALVQAGYRVLGPESAPGPTTAVVHGIVGQYFVEPKINFTIDHEADVAVHLVVMTPSGLRAERTFYVKGESDGVTFSASNFQAASDEATVRIVRAMVYAITQLLDAYPSVGAPSATLKGNPS
jgi:hypothetical protein